MKTYDLAALSPGGGGGGEKKLPPIEETAGGKAAYLKILRAMLRELGQRGRAARSDFDFEQMTGLATRLSLTTEAAVSRVLRLEARRHTDTFMLTAKRALGIDLAESCSRKT